MRVSVIIPTYNRAKLLDRAIQSVLNQTYQDFELILVDDGSTDNTREVVSGFADDRIRYIRLNEGTGGCAAPRNLALGVAQGEYIAILDDDDFWVDEDKLRAQVDFLDAHTDYVLIGTNMAVVDRDGVEVSHSCLPEKDDEIRSQLLWKNCFLHSTVLFRKSTAVDSGGYSCVKGTAYSDDYDMWLKLGTVGKFANLGCFSLAYDLHPSEFELRENKVSLYLRDTRMINKYRCDYPNYWQAIRLRYVGLFNVLLRVISDVPPFINWKRSIKRRCPSCWRAMKFSHRVIFKSMI